MSWNGIDIAVYIDWDRNGNFTGTHDNVTDYVMDARWNIGARQALQRVSDAGRAIVRLRNDSGRFTPENTGSPIYGKILPQRPIRIDLIYKSTTITMFRGYINALRRAFTVSTENVIEIEASDIFAILRDAKLDIELMENVRTDELIRAILTQVQLPPAFGVQWILGVSGSSELGVTTYLADGSLGFSLQTGAITLAYAGDTWTQGITALQAISSVVEAERGRFYFDRDGQAVFLNRQANQLAATPVKTYTAVQAAERTYWQDLATTVKVAVSPRKLETNQTLYTLDKPLTVKAGESRDVRCNFSNDAGVQVAGKDFVTPNIGDGSLAYTTTGSAPIVTLTDSATSAVVTINNTSSTADVEVTTLTVKGTRLTSFGRQEVVAEDVVAVGQYGRREVVIDASLLDDVVEAQSIADYELSLRVTPQSSYGMIRVQNELAADSIALTMFDRIAVDAMPYDNNEPLQIIGESHIWRDGGLRYEYEMYTETARLFQYWNLGVAGYSELGVTTILGY